MADYCHLAIRIGFDRQRAAEDAGSITHDAQTEAVLTFFRAIPSLAVVPDGLNQQAGFVVKRNFDIPRFAVLHGITGSFLRDPVELQGLFIIQQREIKSNVDPASDAEERFHFRTQPG